MDIGKRALSLATALVLGAMIVGLTAEPAAAEKKKKPKPKKQETEQTCELPGSAIDPPSKNDYEFYLPGEVESAVDASGQRRLLECRKDGTWKVVGLVVPAPQRPAGTGRAPVQGIELEP